jgi:DNA-binding transcriptional regulator LsrR (DeoR family)
MATEIEEILLIAYKYYREGKRINEIAVEMNWTEMKVRRRIKAAKDRGMVEILIISPPTFNYLLDLQSKLKFAYDLKDVVVIPGREDIMDIDSSPEKEAILISCCNKAANYLVDCLKNGYVLAIPWGKVAAYIASLLNPIKSLPNLVVVPIVGVMGPEALDYEANTISARIASTFGGKSLLLAAPAVVEPSLYNTVNQLPLVKKVLDIANKADVVLTPIAAANPNTSTIVRTGLATSDEVHTMISRGAVGEIAGNWWFDRQGKLIQRTQAKAIGLGLEGLRNIVRNEKRVIATVAASRERILPLKVALEHRLINVLITDHVTARELLREQNT